MVENYINNILNNIDNCLARRVAYGVGAPLPSPVRLNTTLPTYPLQFGLANQGNLSVEGLVVGILANDSLFSSLDFAAITGVFKSLNLLFEIIAPHQGQLNTSVQANSSYITTSSVFYDAIIIGGSLSSTNVGTIRGVVKQAYSHRKPIGSWGNSTLVLSGFGYNVNASMGVFSVTDATSLAM